VPTRVRSVGAKAPELHQVEHLPQAVEIMIRNRRHALMLPHQRDDVAAADIVNLQMPELRDDVLLKAVLVLFDGARLVVDSRVIREKTIAEHLHGRRLSPQNPFRARIAAMTHLAEPVLRDVACLLEVSSPKRPIAGLRRTPLAVRY
jgi:hypothetical protein